MYLNAESLPLAGEILTHSRDSTNFRAFAWPQLILKQGWQKSSGRFHARLVRSRKREGVLCNKSYVTVHAPQKLLEAAWLTFNSKLAVYFLQLTSGRIAAYRPEALVHDLLALPLPPPGDAVTDDLNNYEAIDARVFEAFGLKDSERVLIEDMLTYTLADFRGTEQSVGRKPTSRSNGDTQEQHLGAYCEYVIRVLKAGFGRDKAVSATIFRQTDGTPLPYRLVAFELGKQASQAVSVSNIQTIALLRELERLDLSAPKKEAPRRGIYNARLARIYDSSSGVPTIFVIKPDATKYWTRSAGLNDGDKIALDLFQWQQQAELKRGAHK